MKWRRVFGLLLTVLTLACACGRGEARVNLPTAPANGETAPLAVPTLRLAREQVSVAVTASGTTEPIRASNISPAISGRIEHIDIEEGQHVTAGQVLVRLDGTLHQLVATQAGQAAAAAHTQAEQVASDYERMAPLARAGSIPAGRADDLARAQTAAASQAAAASSAASAAASVVRDTLVRAPFDGDIAQIPVEIGEMATQMPATIIARLVDLSSVEVKAQVNEADFARLSVGDPVHAHVPSMNLDLDGQVARLGLELNPMTRSGEVVVQIPNTERRLRGGLFVELRVEPSRTREAMLVPRVAVSAAEGPATAYVIEGGVAHARQVEVRRFDDDRVEIVSGLEPGQEVAAGSLTELTDGRAVTSGVAPTSAPSGTPAAGATEALR